MTVSLVHGILLVGSCQILLLYLMRKFCPHPTPTKLTKCFFRQFTVRLLLMMKCLGNIGTVLTETVSAFWIKQFIVLSPQWWTHMLNFIETKREINANSKNARPHRMDRRQMEWGSGGKMLARPSELDATPGQVFQVTLGNTSLFTLVCNHHLHSFTEALLSWHTDQSLRWQPWRPQRPKKPAGAMPILQLRPDLPWLSFASRLARRSVRTYGLHDELNCLSAFQQRPQPNICMNMSPVLQSSHVADVPSVMWSLSSLFQASAFRIAFKNTQENGRKTKLEEILAITAVNSPHGCTLSHSTSRVSRPQNWVQGDPTAPVSSPRQMLNYFHIQRSYYFVSDFVFLVKDDMRWWTMNLTRFGALITFSSICRHQDKRRTSAAKE